MTLMAQRGWDPWREAMAKCRPEATFAIGPLPVFHKKAFFAEPKVSILSENSVNGTFEVR